MKIFYAFRRSVRLAALMGAVSASCAAMADAPADYYRSCENKGGATLLSSLQSVVGPHTNVGYDGLWSVYATSDVTSAGLIWDMYSTKRWSLDKERCGNYKNVGDCYNREHSMPKSWFAEAQPMKSDAFHVYPTDGRVNSQRSNYPYGECAGGTTLPSNGTVKALGRLGSCTSPGYTGTVFEPDDEYKGDFARTYFYMAAAYNDVIKGWSSAMLNGTSYPVYTGWAIDVLLKWHRQDPVSRKEIDRNEAVYAKQGNRNPFIDHPEMAEYIWGAYKDDKWTLASGGIPAIVLPADGSVINMGTAGTGVARTATVSVKGTSLTQAVTLSMSGAGFSVSPSTLSASAANSGTDVTVTFTATAAGSYSGTLKAVSGNLSSTVAVSVTAVDGLPATAPTHVSDCSFVAHWTYIGNEDSNGCYRLTVLDADGEVVDTYPRSVPARDEEALVDELESSTAYTYYLSTASGLSSNRISVSTGAPIPSVQFLYSGELHLATRPGEPSESAEVILDIDNIDTDITLDVDAPFQLSSDKDTWATSLTVSPVEDRFYIRVNSATAGVFESTIRATAGEYFTDDASVTAEVSDKPTFFEGFEAEKTGSYSIGSVQGDAATWLLSDAGVYDASNEARTGSNYLRMGNSAASAATMDTDREHGVGTVTLYAAGWSAKDGSTKFALDWSNDGGENWNSAGEVEIPAPSSSTKSYQPFTFTVNRVGKVRLRLRQTYGKRFCVDDISATDYTSDAIDGLVSDPAAWDAFSRGGDLIVTLADESPVMVVSYDGIILYNGTMSAGENALQLPAGLYIVTVADFSRRVLVR